MYHTLIVRLGPTSGDRFLHFAHEAKTNFVLVGKGDALNGDGKPDRAGSGHESLLREAIEHIFFGVQLGTSFFVFFRHFRHTHDTRGKVEQIVQRRISNRARTL